MRSSFLVFFRPQDCDLARARSGLIAQGLSVEQAEEGLVAGRPGCPSFLVTLNQAPHVLIEAMEIGRGTKHATAMSHCDARFEVQIEDLDDALDEINTLMEVEVGLQEASRGYLFLPWNGSLSGPSDGPA